MRNEDLIKTFVKKTLRCNCPDEVFNLIECQSNISLSHLILGRKINIGNRLLVYIFEVKDEESLNHVLPFLIESGKAERDELGFNRFRLVLATESKSSVREVAQNIFNNINQDEKIHLHIISKKEISF
jgi:hypothetical protein